jgi:hypothetical protein
MSSRRKRGLAHHQPEAVVLDFGNSEFSAVFLFSALRFLVAVASDFSGCSCVLKVVCTENLIRVDDVMESPKLAE